MAAPAAPRTPPRASGWHHAIEVLSSMRFAISLLTFLAVASVLGTILKQNEPYTNYLNQFGPFWFAVFESLSLYAVYNAWWFVLILAFLVTSTSLCVLRNAPKMIAQMRTFKEHLREQSFAAFAHRAEFRAGGADVVARVQAGLKQAGFNTKLAVNESGTMVAAKAGSANRLGYIFAHTGIIIICIGGLLDGDLILRAQMAFGGKEIVRGSPMISDIPAKSRLAESNPSFRGNILIPEGGARDFALLNHADGLLVQELPFKIDLKRFVIEHYDTGQPKLFASDVMVTDKDTGKSFERRIEVNHPLIHRGIAIYQSSFDDGGTRVKLKGFPMSGERDYSFTIAGEIGGATVLTPGGNEKAAERAGTGGAVAGGKLDGKADGKADGKTGGKAGDDTAEAASAKSLTLEFTGFRLFNIERIARSEPRTEPDGAGSGTAAPRTDADGTPRPGVTPTLAEKLKQGLGPGSTPGKEKDMRNVGPSITYKLRDAEGQAREFHNYMLPMLLDGRQVLLAGMREDPNESFRYLRLPIDSNGSLDEFMRLRAAVLDRELHQTASANLARRMLPADATDLFRGQLSESARRALETFGSQGFQAVAAFIEKGVPETEREKAADVFVRLLNGAAFEVWQLRRERDGLKRVPADEVTGRFVQDSLNAISDSFFYGAPVYLHLNSFDEVKASVFQLTRSPGKNIVYLGSLLLVLGVFAMLYIRERRAWALVKPDGRVLFAMSALRRGVDDDREFARLSGQLNAQLRSAPPGAHTDGPGGDGAPSGSGGPSEPGARTEPSEHTGSGKQQPDKSAGST